MFGSGLGSRKRSDEELEVEINMVPVMNMFLVLIPFLLMSSNFLPLFVINTSVPVHSQPVSVDANEPEKKPEIKVKMVVKLNQNGFELEGIADGLSAEEIKQLSAFIPSDNVEGYPFNQLVTRLQQIKTKYPASDTLILMPSGDILYDTIIRAMDVSRSVHNEKLFPNVVVSNEV